jgi:hypothetical protein
MSRLSWQLPSQMSKNIDCQGKREAESLARQEALASAPASRAAFALC